MQDDAQQADHLQRFLFDSAAVRGEWLQLKETWQTVKAQRDYPPAVAKLLGEMLGAAALLAETVKMDGRLVLQCRSQGPVSLLMVECTSEHTLRGLANWTGDIADDASMQSLLADGTLVLTIENAGAKQPYQGVVSIHGESIAEALETYFAQSEQLNTRIWLRTNEETVGGLMLQQLPEQDPAKHDEDWQRLNHLAATITSEELLDLDAVNLLHRLFNEETVRLMSTTVLEFACTCSRQRVADTIKLLGQQEAEEIIEERGFVELACEFCNTHYQFDPVDVAGLFNDPMTIQSDSKTLH
ncbi:Hsp33 family molecular chaperone HslO [Methylophaga sp. OBS3]|uniref:Hsp33 family molecular chaperone HslO n=1 Tax=Methylophaga sp. OBS3 TaxID=2991934 RepID=UPI00224FDACC|nr:Hsp33 family molecular chaperone HslO [Methylophaga sp. OBS3]MCX4188805.1 Hsp33 family molecular chaperone HslO [Methylophaga sp. OBS3]